MEIKFGELNLIEIDSEQRLSDIFFKEDSIFINFSFEHAIKLVQRKNQFSKKLLAENLSNLGLQLADLYDNPKLIELVLAAQKYSEDNKNVFIGTAGCSIESIEILQSCLNRMLRNNSNKTIVLVNISKSQRPNFSLK